VGASGCVPAVVYAGMYPDRYWDDSKSFLANFLPNLPSFSPEIQEAVPEKPIAELIISALSLICYGTAGALSLESEFA
jgi:hypothetical protein